MITQMVADGRLDAKALRPTSAVQPFPWLVKLVTLVRVTPNGVIRELVEPTNATASVEPVQAPQEGGRCQLTGFPGRAMVRAQDE